LLLVLSQTFTVVGDENHEGLIKKMELAQGTPENPHLLINVPEFRVVSDAVTSAVSGGKVVRSVKVIKMKTEEERTAGICLQPLDGGSNDLCPQTLDVTRVSIPFPMGIEGAVIFVEALIQSEPAVKREAAHESGCVVAARFQEGGKRHGVGPQSFSVVLDVIEERIGGCEEGNVRREG
jgi:hypothetical protein